MSEMPKIIKIRVLKKRFFRTSEIEMEGNIEAISELIDNVTDFFV